MKIIKRIAGLCLSALFLLACEKKEFDNETQSIIDHVLCEQEYTSIQTEVYRRINATLEANGGPIQPCDAAELESGDLNWGTPGHVDPVFKIDYAQCPTSADGKHHTGILRIRLNANIANAGARAVIHLQNYSTDNIVFSADSLVLSTLTLNSFHSEVLNGRATGSDFTILWSTDKTVTMDPKSPNDDGDDEVIVTGNASGRTRKGRNFTVTIPSPLIKRNNCDYITSGSMNLTPDGFRTRSVDFGNGECDDLVEIRVNGQTVLLHLNKFM